jgi:hypothetical protein
MKAARWEQQAWVVQMEADIRPVRLDLSAESADIQQYFSLTTN